MVELPLELIHIIFEYSSIVDIHLASQLNRTWNLGFSLWVTRQAYHNRLERENAMLPHRLIQKIEDQDLVGVVAELVHHNYPLGRKKLQEMTEKLNSDQKLHLADLANLPNGSYHLTPTVNYHMILILDITNCHVCSRFDIKILQHHADSCVTMYSTRSGPALTKSTYYTVAQQFILGDRNIGTELIYRDTSYHITQKLQNSSIKHMCSSCWDQDYFTRRVAADDFYCKGCYSWPCVECNIDRQQQEFSEASRSCYYCKVIRASKDPIESHIL